MTHESIILETALDVLKKKENSNPRYILCRPQGGLNDMLGEIEKCCQYGKKFNRIVIVDTNYLGSNSFHDDLSKYFVSIQENLILSLDKFKEVISRLDVYPKFLDGKVNSYSIIYKEGTEFPIDDVAGKYISFDFNKDYSEKLLVHHASGGATNSHLLFRRLKLREELISELQNRLTDIGGSYLGLHIRNTDYFSDYLSVVPRIEKQNYQKIFISTDNQATLDLLKEKLKKDCYSFASVLSNNNEPIHLQKNLNRQDIYRRNVDSILDLIMLALAKKLICLPISGRRGNDKSPIFSGYSILSMNLRTSRDSLSLFLSNTSIQFRSRKFRHIERFLFMMRKYYLMTYRQLIQTL